MTDCLDFLGQKIVAGSWVVRAERHGSSQKLVYSAVLDDPIQGDGRRMTFRFPVRSFSAYSKSFGRKAMAERNDLCVVIPWSMVPQAVLDAWDRDVESPTPVAASDTVA